MAQTGKLTGRIWSENEPISNVTITSENVSVLTDEEGQYSIELKAGMHIIRISHPDFTTLSDTVLIIPHREILKDHVLVPGKLLSEVAVLGSRSRIIHRYNAVPVDEFRSNLLARTGQISLTQMLQFSAPSFNTSRELLYESSSLRGLDPQHTIILLNGIRYHTLARINGGNLRGQLGRGSVGNDLNSIPFPAINKVSVLRDGASAQYGSDGIAGVINIDLKRTNQKGSVNVHLGQYYPGDGEKVFLGFNKGAPISSKGFINFSGSMKFQAPTYRGGVYNGTVYSDYPSTATKKDSMMIRSVDDSMVLARGFNRDKLADNAGNIKTFSAGLLVHSGYKFKSQTELFMIATSTTRQAERNALYRFPKDKRAVNTSLYPEGFQPITHQTSTDFTVISGLKSKQDKPIRWDISTSYGSNAISSRVTNSNNASQSRMGTEAPTAFLTGRDLYSLWVNSANFSRQFKGSKGLFRSLNLAGGIEWRIESLKSQAGEESSWKNYEPSGPWLGGSQGSTGTSPENEIKRSRDVTGIYLDIEYEPAKKLLIDLAGRYEYYNDYKGNLAGKLALRYEFIPALAMRLSLGNGFRAPALQQKYLNNIQNSAINTVSSPVFVVSGLFANDHQVVKAFGVPELEPERSTNISAGLMANISDKIRITVDAYGIGIKDRIILTGPLHRGIPGVRPILDSIPGLRAERVQFFTNAIDTWTNGIDLIAEGNWNLGKDRLNITIAANFNSSEVVGPVRGTEKLPADNDLTKAALFNNEEITKLEDGQPNNKIIVSASYWMKRIQFNLRITRFGNTVINPYYSSLNGYVPQKFSARMITDLNFTYPICQWAVINIGANNIFNVYPDKLNDPRNNSQGMWIYSPEATPFSFNGGYYFLAMQFNW
jgi:iron complex outermembrane receptor protein